MAPSNAEFRFMDRLNDELAKRGVPKLARDHISDAIFNKNWGLLGKLLDAARISGASRDAIIDWRAPPAKVEANGDYSSTWVCK